MAAHGMEREKIFKYPYDPRFIRTPTLVLFGRGSQAPSIATRAVGAGALGSLAVGVLGLSAGVLTFLLALKGIRVLEGTDPGTVALHVKGWASVMFPDLFPEEWIMPREEWLKAASAAKRGLVAGAATLAGAAGAAGAAVGLKLGWKGFSEPMDGHMHIKGRRLLDNEAAVAAWRQAMKAESKGKKSEEDIELIPGIPTSAERMKKHAIVLGPPGSGKTVLLGPFIERAIRSDGRVLIFDVKGDFTETFYKETYDKSKADTDPGTPTADNKSIILCPFDKRSDVWDIAADIRDKQDAVEFAEANIPTPAEDKMWAQSAQAVVIGVVHMLQCERPGTWTCGDMASLLGLSDMKVYIAIMKRYHPEGLRAVDTADVTQAGVMTNVMAAMAPMFSLADAWPERVEGRMFSVRKWAEAQGDELARLKKTVIIKGSPQYPAVTRACAGAVFQLAQSILTSLPDDPDRAFYLILDEFPALGKVEIERLITLGRSKGVRVWLAMQTLAQFKQVHGEDLANSLKDNVSTFITLGAVGPGADEVAGLIGERTVERMSVSGTGPNAVVNAQLQTMKTIEPAQVALLGVRDGQGVKAGIWGKGLNDLLLLDIPFPNKLEHPLIKTSRANVFSDWIKAENNLKMMDIRKKRGEAGSAFLCDMAAKYGDESFKPKEAGAKEAGASFQPAPPAPKVPNCTDPEKPFVPSAGADKARADKERMQWAKLRCETSKVAQASEGVVRQAKVRARDDEDEDRDDEEGAGGDGGSRGNGMGRAGGGLAERVAATNDPAVLARLLEEAEGSDPAAAGAARAKLRMAKLRGAGQADRERPAGTAAKPAGGSFVQDAPIMVANPAALAYDAAMARRPKGAEGEDDPFTEAVGQQGEISVLGSLFGSHLAEILVHAAEAADASAQGGPRARPPAAIPVFPQKRKTTS